MHRGHLRKSGRGLLQRLGNMATRDSDDRRLPFGLDPPPLMAAARPRRFLGTTRVQATHAPVRIGKRLKRRLLPEQAIRPTFAGGCSAVRVVARDRPWVRAGASNLNGADRDLRRASDLTRHPAAGDQTTRARSHTLPAAEDRATRRRSDRYPRVRTAEARALAFPFSLELRHS
jgi:hypothetical protein